MNIFIYLKIFTNRVIEYLISNIKNYYKWSDKIINFQKPYAVNLFLFDILSLCYSFNNNNIL